MGIFRAFYYLITAGGAAAEIAGYAQSHDCDSASVATTAAQSTTDVSSLIDPLDAVKYSNMVKALENTSSVSNLYSTPDAVASTAQQFPSEQGQSTLASIVEFLFD